MIISSDVKVPFLRPLVYQTYRDKLLELLPFLPNANAIEIKSRTETVGGLNAVNVWQGGGEIPVAAKAIITPDMLSWTEYNTWNDQAFILEWKIETHAFTEAIHCAGRNTFVEKDQATVVECRGELIINPEKIKGVPPFIRGTVAQVIEEFLVAQMEPNLVQMAEGVRQYLERTLTAKDSA